MILVYLHALDEIIEIFRYILILIARLKITHPGCHSGDYIHGNESRYTDGHAGIQHSLCEDGGMRKKISCRSDEYNHKKHRKTCDPIHYHGGYGTAFEVRIRHRLIHPEDISRNGSEEKVVEKK